MAFLDVNPLNPGHTLVVPKTHVADLSTCPPNLAAHLFGICATLAPAVAEAVEADGFNVWTANGWRAGQAVFQLHLNILPRFPSDDFGLQFPKNYPQAAERGTLDAIAGKIRVKG